MIGHKGEQAVTVRALRGAAPYIHMYKGKVFVIKTGGGAFRDQTTMRAFVEQVAILHHLGIRVVLLESSLVVVEPAPELFLGHVVISTGLACRGSSSRVVGPSPMHGRGKSVRRRLGGVKHSAVLGALAAAVLLALGSACGGSDGGNENAEAQESSRCTNVPRGLVEEIEKGLTVQGTTLTNARAVKSEDFKQVQFVSAEIEGPGIDGSGQIGTWAKGGSLGDGGGVTSVDGFALEYSDWADGPLSDAELSVTDDGAQESRDCVAAVG